VHQCIEQEQYNFKHYINRLIETLHSSQI